MKKSILLLVIIFILLGVIIVLFTLMLKNQRPSSIQLQQSLSDSSEIAKLDDGKELLAENLEGAESTESTIWQTFRDERFGYTIEYPQDWYIAQSENITIKGFWPKKYEGEASGVWVDVKDNPNKLSALQWWEQEIDELANKVELINNTTIEKITLDSIQGIEIKTVKDYFGRPFKIINLPYKSKIYRIHTNIPDDDTFNQIIMSFKFIEAIEIPEEKLIYISFPSEGLTVDLDDIFIEGQTEPNYYVWILNNPEQCIHSNYHTSGASQADSSGKFSVKVSVSQRVKGDWKLIAVALPTGNAVKYEESGCYPSKNISEPIEFISQ